MEESCLHALALHFYLLITLQNALSYLSDLHIANGHVVEVQLLSNVLPIPALVRIYGIILMGRYLKCVYLAIRAL